jgi:hypothetical protein
MKTVSAMPGRREVGRRLAHDVAGVAAVGLAGDRVVDVAVHHQGLVLAEDVLDRGGGVRDQEHVRLLDALEPAHRRAVEVQPVAEGRFGDLVRRHGEVLHEPREVDEPQVDELVALVFDEGEDVRC